MSTLVVNRPLFFRDKYAINVDDNVVLMKGPCRRTRVKLLSSKAQIDVFPNLETEGSTLDVKVTLTQKTLKCLLSMQCSFLLIPLLGVLLGNPQSLAEFVACFMVPYILVANYFGGKLMTLPNVIKEQATSE